MRPSATNSHVVNFDQDHIVWLLKDGSKRLPTLMLLLAGTNGQPSNASLIGATAARQGYHVIGLMYPDDVAVQSVCPGDPNPSCAADLRREVITGENISPYVSVDFDNSIDGRLTAILQYLIKQYPDENWQQFLDQNQPRWANVAVGGLSQGGGHAAFIGTMRLVRRVVMFGAPADGMNGAPTPWASIGATPASRYYGFKHELDPFTSIVPNWHALGIDAFGPPINIDDGLPITTTHLFLTNVAATSALNAHASVYADGATPVKDGIPVFLAAWKYLLGP
ncbi:MAG TPA: hypothetical protein VM099_03650 [Gemmatimonadaceae bacterium]|nr:hypothetical protein [Gemmatimonadaceae bacterium]